MRDEANHHCLDRISFYCGEILGITKSIDYNYEIFLSGQSKYSLPFLIMQIGELTKLLDDDFITKTKASVPWQQIRGMRNMVAHGYETMSLAKIWNTAIDDIPILKLFCDDYNKSDS
jgi:uncharacterized protein with HEPN domain